MLLLLLISSDANCFSTANHHCRRLFISLSLSCIIGLLLFASDVHTHTNNANMKIWANVIMWKCRNVENEKMRKCRNVEMLECRNGPSAATLLLAESCSPLGCYLLSIRRSPFASWLLPVAWCQLIVACCNPIIMATHYKWHCVCVH